ncbi:MAG: glycosyltransferase family 2 protein [Lachnospiraceae bacterium]|nr:glycosyltransferase family 2 protein [Lachnospiraceae bacterium]
MESCMESKKQGRISIIMPVYNGVSWIGECIESIRQQTDTNWELLVLDDHSTDGTTELVLKLAEEDSRILPILRQKNGVSAARNEGLEKAQGEFIMFVDADDKLDPQMLSVLRAMLGQTESDLAVCDYYRWNGKPDGVYNRSEELLKTDVERGENAARANKVLRVDGVRVYNRSEYVSDYLLRGNTRCWSVLYRRSAIGQIRFREDLSIGEDMMFLMDLLMQTSSVSITEYRGYFYRINEQGAMLKPFKPSYMDEIKSWELACRLVEKEFPSQKGRVYSILAVSAMLAAGKIARLPGAERKKYQTEVAQCHSAVQKGLAASGAKEELPKGYRIKTMLFTACPALYLALYHHWKS